MSSSKHQIAVTGVDKTGAAFQSIQARAAAAGQRISRIMGGALAAAGAYLSLRSVGSAVNRLGALSDVAQKTGSSVEDLTKTVTALQILGVNTSIEALAKSFSLMEKNTGRSGLTGFFETIEELREIPDLAERSNAAFKIFGRSGAELMPLVNSANDAVKAVRSVSDGILGIPDKAAAAGDRAADAFKTMTTGIQSIWYQFVAKIVGHFDKNFSGGIREASAKGVAILQYFAKASYRFAKAFAFNWRQTLDDIVNGLAWGFESLVRYFGTLGMVSAKMWGRMFSDTARVVWGGEDLDLSIGAIFERAGGAEANETLMRRLRGARHMMIASSENVKTDDLREELTRMFRAAEEAAKAAEEGLGRVKEAAKENGEKVAEVISKASARISNNLIMAGSNNALKLRLLGPSYQSEEVKQTALLKTIAENTKQTAEQRGETLYQTDLD